MTLGLMILVGIASVALEMIVNGLETRQQAREFDVEMAKWRASHEAHTRAAAEAARRR
jgi:hypothetical protein